MRPEREPWPAKRVSEETMKPRKRTPPVRTPTRTAAAKLAPLSTAQPKILRPPRTTAAVAASPHLSYSKPIRNKGDANHQVGNQPDDERGSGADVLRARDFSTTRLPGGTG